MTIAAIPLLARHPGEVVAIRGGVGISAEEFLAQVSGLAEALPTSGSVINVCEDRYRFFLGFAAALTRGLTTLLPPNALASTVNGICRDWRGSIVLSDTNSRQYHGQTVIANSSIVGSSRNPSISAGMVAAVAFTSGSTGLSTPHEKSWSALTSSADINLRYFFERSTKTFSVVSTVPAQHMYGLETTVLSAMCGPIALHHGRPFYPADVALALQEVPEPRVLVSTPIHLRALLGSGLRFPPLARVLSATAPLDVQLAASLETLFGTEVVEIYGCTEVGSMASRRTATGRPWTFFDGFHAESRPDGTWIDAGHLQFPVHIPDALEFYQDGGFVLAGRDGDLLKVAGKRSSVSEVTGALLRIDGVDDAVVFQYPDSSNDAHLVAMVASSVLNPAKVRAALKHSLDPAFIPRPILMVRSLPRSTTGKLTRDSVVTLYLEALKNVAQP